MRSDPTGHCQLQRRLERLSEAVAMVAGEGRGLAATNHCYESLLITSATSTRSWSCFTRCPRCLSTRTSWVVALPWAPQFCTLWHVGVGARFVWWLKYRNFLKCRWTRKKTHVVNAMLYWNSMDRIELLWLKVVQPFWCCWGSFEKPSLWHHVLSLWHSTTTGTGPSELSLKIAVTACEAWQRNGCCHEAIQANHKAKISLTNCRFYCVYILCLPFQATKPWNHRCGSC